MSTLAIATFSMLMAFSPGAPVLPRTSHALAATPIISPRGSASLVSAARAPFVTRRARARTPVAFDGGAFELSDAEITALLGSRGIVVPDGATRNELLSLLSPEPVAPPPVTPPSDLLPAEAQRVDVFERVSPAVAFVQTSFVTEGSKWALFSGGQEYPAGAGSGFVWNEDGIIVTNFHVINGGPLRPTRGRPDLPRKITVKLQGRDEPLEASVVGVEPDKDLAVLKVDPSALKLTPVELAASSALKVGADVLAIGNPFGLDWTLTRGIVSAIGRDVDGAGGRPIRDCIQTDAAINPGNSGGPLLDSRGRLIGVNTMIYAPNGLGANVGIGFAVPSDTVSRIVTQILERGPNARPSLGISVLPDEFRKQYAKHLRRDLEGALIAEVVPGSPAEELQLAACEKKGPGVLLGDMIIAVNDVDVKKNEDLLCAIEESAPDAPLRLSVMRGCDPKKIEDLEVVPVPRNLLASGRE